MDRVPVNMQQSCIGAGRSSGSDLQNVPDCTAVLEFAAAAAPAAAHNPAGCTGKVVAVPDTAVQTIDSWATDILLDTHPAAAGPGLHIEAARDTAVRVAAHILHFDCTGRGKAADPVAGAAHTAGLDSETSFPAPPKYSTSRAMDEDGAPGGAYVGSFNRGGAVLPAGCVRRRRTIRMSASPSFWLQGALHVPRERGCLSHVCPQAKVLSHDSKEKSTANAFVRLPLVASGADLVSHAEVGVSQLCAAQISPAKRGFARRKQQL